MGVNGNRFYKELNCFHFISIHGIKKKKEKEKTFFSELYSTWNYFFHEMNDGGVNSWWRWIGLFLMYLNFYLCIYLFICNWKWLWRLVWLNFCSHVRHPGKIFQKTYVWAAALKMFDIRMCLLMLAHTQNINTHFFTFVMVFLCCEKDH